MDIPTGRSRLRPSPLSNDDGLHARGIALLTIGARLAFGDDADIVVIAPAEERSGFSHRISLGELHVEAAPWRTNRANRRLTARRARPGFFLSRNMPRAND